MIGASINRRRTTRRCRWEPIMTAFPFLLRKAVLVVACAAAVTTLSQRESFAFSAEAQQMCSGDAFRLCASEIPNIPAITACMIRKRASLSPSCRTVLDREVVKKSGKVADVD
jgi:predicted lysophospholipase L1 biosynthesis ABC-type transport system permease subunit